MTDSFDLTSRPWIPCERADGSMVELSTRDALVEAHTLRAIIDPSPLVVAVLHRHLLAVLHRSYDGPKNMKEWASIAKSGGFEVGRVEGYLNRVRERMDLFHPTHPFAQTRGLVEQFNADPIDQLDIERSSWGTAKALFQHRPIAYRASMGPAEATRGLLMHHAFATGGLVKKPKEPESASASPLVRSALVLLRGETLFQTLISNLLVYNPEHELPVASSGSDAAAWEQPTPPSHLQRKEEPRRLPFGWLDILTWQSRRLELVSSGGVVTGYVRAIGQGMSDGAPQDPMVSYRMDEKRGFVSLGLRKDRAFWRNANALFEATRDGDRRFVRPKTIDLVASQSARDVLGDAMMYRVDLLGLAAEKSRVDLVRAEHVHMMVRLFDDPDARTEVEHAIHLAESAVSSLRDALFSYAGCALSPGDRVPDTKDVSAFLKSLNAEAAAWSALGVEFEVFLLTLASNTEKARNDFERSCRSIAWDRFQAATASGAGAARWLKARAMGERTLRRKLAELSASLRAADEKNASQETHG